MSKLHYQLSTAIGLLLLSSAALAESKSEQVLTNVTEMFIYAFVLFVVVVGILIYFVKFRDKRRTPLDELFSGGESIHSVGPNTLVTDCVRMMSAKKIGALIVMEGERLVGIFTERDALTKVLAAGLEPSKTKVSEVMTKGPYTIPPTTTVGEAMELGDDLGISRS